MKTAYILCFIFITACQQLPEKNNKRVYIQKVQPLRLSEHAVSVKIPLIIPEPFHIQANPASHNYLIATRLSFSPKPGVVFSELKYPAGESYLLEGSADTLMVYDGLTGINLVITHPQEVSKYDLVLEGTLHYQACDHKSCFPPESQSISVDLSNTF